MLPRIRLALFSFRESFFLCRFESFLIARHFRFRYPFRLTAGTGVWCAVWRSWESLSFMTFCYLSETDSVRNSGFRWGPASLPIFFVSILPYPRMVFSGTSYFAWPLVTAEVFFLLGFSTLLFGRFFFSSESPGYFKSPNSKLGYPFIFGRFFKRPALLVLNTSFLSSDFLIRL